MPHLFPPEIIENSVGCQHARISIGSKVQEMNVEEMRVTDGGQMKEYTPLTGNPILDVAISISNAAKWVYNQFQ